MMLHRFCQHYFVLQLLIMVNLNIIKKFMYPKELELLSENFRENKDHFWT